MCSKSSFLCSPQAFLRRNVLTHSLHRYRLNLKNNVPESPRASGTSPPEPSRLRSFPRVLMRACEQSARTDGPPAPRSAESLGANRNMKIEEINAYFKDFDRMGETAVRIAVYSERWRNDLSRLGAAAEWLRLKDEERQSQNSRWGSLCCKCCVCCSNCSNNRSYNCRNGKQRKHYVLHVITPQ